MKKLKKQKMIKDVQVVMEKMGEIIKIATELEKRSSEGDEKAKEELDKWDKNFKRNKTTSVICRKKCSYCINYTFIF